MKQTETFNKNTNYKKLHDKLNKYNDNDLNESLKVIKIIQNTLNIK